MAALDQRCRDNDGEKAGLAQQGARAVQCRRSDPWTVQGLKAEADDGAESRYGAMTQIRCCAAMISTNSPPASAPATNAAEPHNRSGP